MRICTAPSGIRCNFDSLFCSMLKPEGSTLNQRARTWSLAFMAIFMSAVSLAASGALSAAPALAQQIIELMSADFNVKYG